MSLIRQTELLGISKSSLYYQQRPVNLFTLNVMNKIDEINTRWPCWGSRKITAKLNINFKKEKENSGLRVNRKRIKRLMEEMGIEAIYPKRNLSIPDKQHKVYPYLLRDLTISRPNQVWGIDITYIRLVNGWIYLTAIISVITIGLPYTSFGQDVFHFTPPSNIHLILILSLVIIYLLCSETIKLLYYSNKNKISAGLKI